jgi:hypothetical protein
MQHVKSLARIAILPAFLAGLASGCGGDGGVASNPERGEQLKQARLEAYGKSGMPKAAGKVISAASSGGSQGAARGKAQSGR